MNKYLLLFIVVLPLICAGQRPYFQKKGSVDGLESDNVYCVMQDQDGFIWYGTDMGASRYDGYTFENFNFENGLTGNEVFQIFQDSKERIWFLSFNGELSYFQDEKFYNQFNDPLLKQFYSESFLSSIVEFADGTICIANYSGSIFFIDNDNKLTVLQSKYPIYKLWIDETERLNVLNAHGYYYVIDGVFYKEKEFVIDGHFQRAIPDGRNIYFSVGNRIYYYKDKLELVLEFPEDVSVTWMGVINGEVLVGTRTGYYKISLKEGKILSQPILYESVVSFITIDREGVLWVTTLGDGIFLAVSPHLEILTKESELPVNQVICLARGWDNELWIGMRSGYYSKLSEEGLSHYRIYKHENQPVAKIRKIEPDQIGILSKSHFEIKTKEKTMYFPLIGNDFLQHGDTFYIATKQTFKIPKDHFSPDSSAKERSRIGFYESLEDDIILDVNTDALCLGENKQIYCGTQKGLYKNPSINLQNLGEDNCLIKSTINDLTYDSIRNILYVATNNKGLIMMRNDKVIAHFSTRDGLSANNCQSLLLDEEQNLWVGTSKSVDLLKVNRQGEPQLINFGALICLKPIKVNDLERIVNKLYIATDQGLIVSNTDLVDYSKNSPKVFLNEVIISGQQQGLNDESLILKYNENSISFRFLGLGFKNPGGIAYKYKLDGYQNMWKTTSRRRVVYEVLPPGNYTFQLKAVNLRNAQSEIKEFHFVIAHPYWKQLWFILIVLFAGLIGITIIWVLRIRRIRGQYELKSQIVSGELDRLELEKAYLLAEQKAGVLQMNPHFLFNSLNTIKGFYAQNKFAEANRFISKFARLLRRVLESNTQFIPLEKELEILNIYLELMQKRHDDVFEYNVDCRIANIDDLKLPPMLLQPIVENAVIHGLTPIKGGKVEVVFFTEEKHLVCVVSDNGIGFNRSHIQTHQSVGLSNIKDRLKLLSKQFNSSCSLTIVSPIEGNSDGGTLITIKLPLKF